MTKDDWKLTHECVWSAAKRHAETAATMYRTGQIELADAENTKAQRLADLTALIAHKIWEMP